MISDVEINTGDSDFIEVYEKSYVIIHDTIFAFQLDDKLLAYMKAHPNKIRGIHITQLNIEKDPIAFGKCLKDLVNHIIFMDQTCVENLFCITDDDQFFQQIETVIEENSRIITKTNRRFPTHEDNSFKRNIVDMNGSLTIDYHVYYWMTVSNTVEREIEELPPGINPLYTEPYKSSGDYFEPVPEEETEGGDSLSNSSQQQLPKYQKVTIVDTTTFNLKGTYSARCGAFHTGVEIGEKTFSVTYRCRPDEHKKTGCEVTGEIPQTTKIGPIYVEGGENSGSESHSD